MRIKTLFRWLMLCAIPVTLVRADVDAGFAQAGTAARYDSSGGVGERAIADAIAPLFDNAADPPLGETRAVIVLRHGRIVAERYAPGFGPDSLHLSWSVAKTVTAMLVGIMVADGRLALDEPVPLAAWQRPGDPRARVTLRQMLQMTSGIAHNERSGGLENTDTLAMLVGRGVSDMARYASAKPLDAAPGATFTYSSATTLLLCDMMAELLTDAKTPTARRDAMAAFVEQRLKRPAGLASLTPEFDAAGTMMCGAMMHMTARDYARLGELLRLGGESDGRRVLSPNWVRFMTSSSPRNPGYGGHLWLNRAGAENILFVGDAPGSLYGAQGFRGQYVIVSPQQGLTMVRLGVTTEGEMPALRAAMARVVKLYPAR